MIHNNLSACDKNRNSTDEIYVSLLHSSDLLVYCTYMSVFVARCFPPCPTRANVCACRTLLLSLSNNTRQGKH